MSSSSSSSSGRSSRSSRSSSHSNSTGRKEQSAEAAVMVVSVDIEADVVTTETVGKVDPVGMVIIVVQKCLKKK